VKYMAQGAKRGQDGVAILDFKVGEASICVIHKRK